MEPKSRQEALAEANHRIGGSFRDPSGFVFRREGVLYRQVNEAYRSNYDLLKSSGLLDELVASGLLVGGAEVSLDNAYDDRAYAVIKPQVVPFISYPYEWCFEQLKEAALLTLSLALSALDHGMVLKDASAYNVQFIGTKPIFIDTLSFEERTPGEPWIAYRQFCQHFLAPLALMSMVDVRLGRLSRSFIDGVPLDLASHMLPAKSRLKPGLAAHIHMHAKAQAKAQHQVTHRQATLSDTGFRALLDNLRSTIVSLDWSPSGTEWGDYYERTNYSDTALKTKADIVGELLDQVDSLKSCWDLGANNGAMSQLVCDRGAYTVAWDIDPAAVTTAYRRKSESLLPLVLDLTNPSPALGWAHQERDSLINRAPADCILALALIHHLALGNNVPLPSVAEFLATLGRWLIVEFVPKEDSQVVEMLSSRRDVFSDYTKEGFEQAFSTYFECIECRPIPETCRCLYLMKKRSHDVS